MGEVKSREAYVGGTNRHLVIPLYQASRDSRVRLFAWKISCTVHVLGTTLAQLIKIQWKWSNLGLELRLDCDTKYIIAANVDAVVNFLSQVIFVFVLFLGMVMYASEVETKEKQKWREIKN